MPSLLNVLIGEYRVVELLGAGGMGQVYQAVHTHLGRVIAIKVLSPELADGPALKRFYSEAAIQGSLKHPGVAEYLGFYEYQGRPCILMEYVDGETLAAVIQRRGSLPVEEALGIVREIALVAAQFHAQGVVHRDLKTSNVKITTGNRIKVLDFGIARHQRSDRTTRVGAVIGTPETLAPEQIRGQPADKATDVWQIGILFYELLTGKLPFQGSNTHETWGQVLTGDFAPASLWQSAVPPELDRIVAKCLQKDMAQRYQSGAELYEALCQWRTPAHRGLVWPAPRVLAAIALVVLLLACLGVWIAWRSGGSSTTPLSESDPSRAAAAAARSVTVDSANGPAQVFQDGKLLGTTPVQLQAGAGETVKLTLRREGYEDMQVQFDAGERRSYTFAMEPRKEH